MAIKNYRKDSYMTWIQGKGTSAVLQFREVIIFTTEKTATC